MIKILFATLLAGTVAVAAAAENRYPAARKLVRYQGCQACHSLQGKGGDFAVPLDNLGNRLTREEFCLFLQKGKNSPAEPFMPPYDHLSEEELELLVGYLLLAPPKP